jgi:hypothetical protein
MLLPLPNNTIINVALIEHITVNPPAKENPLLVPGTPTDKVPNEELPTVDLRFSSGHLVYLSGSAAVSFLNWWHGSLKQARLAETGLIAAAGIRSEAN